MFPRTTCLCAAKLDDRMGCRKVYTVGVALITAVLATDAVAGSSPHVLPPDPRSNLESGCQQPVQRPLDLTKVSYSSSGDWGPHGIRFEKVSDIHGVPVDLVMSGDDQKTTKVETSSREGYGRITMMAGMRANIMVSFVISDTVTPIAIDMVDFTVLNNETMDEELSEKVTFGGYPTQVLRRRGRELARSASFLLQNVSTFSLRLEASGQRFLEGSVRSFLFAATTTTLVPCLGAHNKQQAEDAYNLASPAPAHLRYLASKSSPLVIPGDCHGADEVDFDLTSVAVDVASPSTYRFTNVFTLNQKKYDLLVASATNCSSILVHLSNMSGPVGSCLVSVSSTNLSLAIVESGTNKKFHLSTTYVYLFDRNQSQSAVQNTKVNGSMPCTYLGGAESCRFNGTTTDFFTVLLDTTQGARSVVFGLKGCAKTSQSKESMVMAALTPQLGKCGKLHAVDFSLTHIVHNNLGGAGPDSDKPTNIRYANVLVANGKALDLVIGAWKDCDCRIGQHQPCNASLDGNNGLLGNINLKVNSMSFLKFQFVQAGTSIPAHVPQLYVTFLDFDDRNSREREMMWLSGSTSCTHRGVVEKADEAGSTFISSEKGDSSDNPSSPYNLSKQQLHRSVTCLFKERAEIPVTLRATKPKSRLGSVDCGAGDGRNVLFSIRACIGDKFEYFGYCQAEVCGLGYKLKTKGSMMCAGAECTVQECCVPDAPTPEDQLQLVAKCRGRERQWADCKDIPSCTDCVPKDCQFAEWTEWYPMQGCTGLCQRARTILTANNECGKGCVGAKVETKTGDACLQAACKDVDFKQDCKWSEWDEWTFCSNPAAQAHRKRKVVAPASHGGKPCEGSFEDTRPCGEFVAQDCTFSDWAEWTMCSATCGSGWRVHLRRVVRYAKFSGKPCKGPLRETFPCNEKPCGQTRDCQVGDWSMWKGCTPEVVSQTQRTRTRQILMPSLGGGQPCNTALSQTAQCHNVNASSTAKPQCEFTEWSEWKTCDKTCDGGQTSSARRMRGIRECLLFANVDLILKVVFPLKKTKACNTQSCHPNLNEPCKLSAWSPWAECSSECGVGVTQRHRKVESAGAQACVGGLAEVARCLVSSCNVVDCKWADWDPWSACTCTCGGGTKRRNRIVKVAPRHGGQLCDTEDKSEVAPCNEQTCDNCIDGQWGAWAEWESCSRTCGPIGYQVRHREVEKHANRCGKPVNGLEDEYQLCSNLPPCEATEDCQLSEWATWSACSCSCFGIKERSRSILQYAKGGGKQCVNEALKQMSPCSPAPGEQAPQACGLALQKSACVLSTWEEWGGCSAVCGGGQRSRTRHILTPSSGGGIPCEGSLLMVAPCNIQKCEKDCLDCQWGDWSDWGGCSKCGGQRYRNRGVKTMPNHCGKICTPGEAKQVSNCTQKCVEKPGFCGWTEWIAASECSATCGASTKMRQRQLTYSMTPPKKPEDLLFSGTGSTICSGSQIIVDQCKLGPCTTCVAVDCVLSDWLDWTTPTCTQLCERHREVKVVNKCGGEACTGPLVETKRCLKNCHTADQCVFGGWEDWTDCEASTSQQFRNRVLLEKPDKGGCKGVMNQTRSCSNSEIILDCQTTSWSPWSSCTHQCGGGTRTRNRVISQKASGGGVPCKADMQELTSCRTQPCKDQNQEPCKFEPWMDWSHCGHNNQKQRRREVIEGAFGHAGCDGALDEIQGCFTHVDCIVSDWTHWDVCDRTCGGGEQIRQRQVTQSPRNHGKACDTNLVEVRTCNEESCALADCEVSTWTEWLSCSATCGEGHRKRHRYIKNAPEGGAGCTLDLSEVEPCKLGPCAKADCKWGEWLLWSMCSASCDSGSQYRTREIAVMPAGGGKLCEPVDKEEYRQCNLGVCNAKSTECIDGAWEDWTDWESCSATCAGGITWRNRKVLQDANDCGRPPSGLSQEVSSCNAEIPCVSAANCSFGIWTDWNDCSNSCSGMRKRTRKIAHPRVGLGAPCHGSLQQLESCNANGEWTKCELVPAEPVDCEFSEWSDWGSCSATCGGGQYVRSRGVMKEPAGGGKPCSGPTASIAPCGVEACGKQCVPQDCIWEQWSDWGACGKCGGQRQRYRRLKPASCGGRPCQSGDAQETSDCDRHCGKTLYCAWASWDAWSACSASCGHGVRSRERLLKTTSLSAEMGVRMLLPPVGMEGDLQTKFEELHSKTLTMKTRRIQELVLAWAAGALSLVTVLGTVRLCSRRKEGAISYRAVGDNHDGDIE